MHKVTMLTVQMIKKYIILIFPIRFPQRSPLRAVGSIYMHLSQERHTHTFLLSHMIIFLELATPSRVSLLCSVGEMIYWNFY